MMKYILLFLLVSCAQVQVPNTPIFKKTFEVNKIDERKFEIYY